MEEAVVLGASVLVVLVVVLVAVVATEGAGGLTKRVRQSCKVERRRFQRHPCTCRFKEDCSRGMRNNEVAISARYSSSGHATGDKSIKVDSEGITPVEEPLRVTTAYTGFGTTNGERSSVLRVPTSCRWAASAYKRISSSLGHTLLRESMRGVEGGKLSFKYPNVSCEPTTPPFSPSNLMVEA